MQDFTKHPKFAQQLALEKEMVSRGADIYRRKLSEAKADNLESTTPQGSYLVRRAIKAVADGLRAFLAKADKPEAA